LVDLYPTTQVWLINANDALLGALVLLSLVLAKAQNKAEAVESKKLDRNDERGPQPSSSTSSLSSRGKSSRSGAEGNSGGGVFGLNWNYVFLLLLVFRDATLFRETVEYMWDHHRLG
jgi:hypothetical protein